MKDVNGFMKYCFKKDIPKPIHEYVKYVASLKYNDKPDYAKCRKMFESGLKELKKPNSGDLEFETKPSQAPSPAKRKNVEPDSAESSGPMARPRGRPPKVISTSPDTTTRDVEPAKRKTETPSKPVQRKKKNTVAIESPEPEVNGHKTSTPSSEVVSAKLSAQEQTGSVRLNTKLGGSGTPKSGSKAKKTYAFNFELDVSIDADVIVNVRRKKKPAEASPAPRRRSQSASPSPAVLPKRARRQNASYNEDKNSPAVPSANDSIISLNTTEGSVQPDDDTIPNSDPNTPDPRYLASRSIVHTPQQKKAQPIGRTKARVDVHHARAGEYKGKKAKS